ncbi:hypothetical protein BST65_06515 [Bradyrhizobium canariense]|nr:hypothetical protein BST65_06515 [Bradyrhizobium canariense]OSI37314.1 hypothetical protein BST66_03700 [Bradyrhizobium canariense]OSI52034.1 hypothetical protein BSZ20_04175 [Bradyrhizobium canariense]OSI56337.1 hypothetical protein BST67_03665 [Bradyrhizobium canariense]OSI59409.1 hypothetical protein BSZ15_04895 [Bradyrhizobium canariense]
MRSRFFELGKDLFERVQVDVYFGSGGADELAHGFASVTAEIVQDYDIGRTNIGRRTFST